MSLRWVEKFKHFGNALLVQHFARGHERVLLEGGHNLLKMSSDSRMVWAVTLPHSLLAINAPGRPRVSWVRSPVHRSASGRQESPVQIGIE